MGYNLLSPFRWPSSSTLLLSINYAGIKRNFYVKLSTVVPDERKCNIKASKIFLNVCKHIQKSHNLRLLVLPMQILYAFFVLTFYHFKNRLPYTARAEKAVNEIANESPARGQICASRAPCMHVTRYKLIQSGRCEFQFK